MNTNIYTYNFDELKNVHQEYKRIKKENHRIFLLYDVTGIDPVIIERETACLNLINKIEGNLLIIII